MSDPTSAAPSNEGGAGSPAAEAPRYSVYPPDEGTAPAAPASTAQPAQAPASGSGEPPPESDSADDTGADKQGDGDKPRSGGIQKRISELTARHREAEREAAYWREQATRGQQQPQGQQAPQQPQGQGQGQGAQAPALPPDLAAFVGKEPRPEDFPGGEWDSAFVRAAARYDARMDQAQLALGQRQAVQRQQQAAFAGKVRDVVAEASALGADVADVLQSNDFPMPEHVGREVMECEKPSAVLAHLARNPEEARALAALRNPAAVARALGKLEAKISAPAAPPAPPPPKPSNAPPPPRTVGGRGAVAKSVYDLGDNPDPAEYRRLRGY